MSTQNRPRRTSTLQDRSPAKPQPATEPNEPAAIVGESLRGTPPQQSSPPPEPAAEKAHGERIYIRPSDKARAEAAMYATVRHTGMKPSFSAFAVEAINRLTRELEAQYNDGNAF